MDIDFYVKKYLQNYNLLIEKLVFLFNEEEYKQYIVILNGESKDKKWLRGVKFQQQISDELFNTFLESKIKLFSHKDENSKKLSESLFGSELSLKKIFNNRDDNTKFILWSYIHSIVLMVELAQTNQNKNRVDKLTKLINDSAPLLEKIKTKNNIKDTQNIIKDAKTMCKEMFNVDVNDQTNDMLNDIVKSFETSLKGEGGNPLNGIMDISQKISSKYQDKINTGEIEINKLIEGIQKNIPGMEELLKGGMGEGISEDMMGGMMGGMMGNMMGGNTTKTKETVIIDENFSTADVELGKQKENKSNFNIGKMLKLANSFGVLGGDGKGDPKTVDPNMSELFGMLSTMGKSNSKEDIDNLKTKMDEFLAKQGIDISKLNKQIDTMTQEGNANNDSKENDDVNNNTIKES
jgi:hypothetical protein